MEEGWRIELLGGLQVVCGERVITRFRTRKTRALLAYLTYFLTRPHPRAELVDLFWPENEPEAGSNNLRKALSSLRLSLERPDPPAGELFLSDRETVRLNPARVTTDVAELDATLRAADGVASEEERARLLAHAVELYRGPLLPGHYEDWVLQERAWLGERWFEALRRLIALREAAGDIAIAVEYARQAVRADPLREEAHRELIRLLAACGQSDAAFRQYGELKRLLAEQLDTTPDTASRALVREIERLTALRAPGVELPGARKATPAPEGENRLVHRGGDSPPVDQTARGRPV